MKIIHCADLHLESELRTHLDPETAKGRRDELLSNFDRLIEYANDNDVEIILLAGDIFDRGQKRKSAVKRIIEGVRENPQITFVFLKGNHDTGGVFDDELEIPDNAKLFDEKQWKKYEFGDVIIKGVELSKDNYKDVALNLVLDPGKCNIVMLHSGAANYVGEKEIYEINFNDLKNKNIDYLALGHIHKYQKDKLDDRGVYVYPGCLEGRGFDETGDKGFVLLEIEDGVITDTFIPFAQRILHRLVVEVQPEDSMADIISNIHDSVDLVSPKDLVKVVLEGKTSMDDMVDIDIARIKREFANQFYFFKVQDDTTVKVDYDSFANDKSLKGEFIRLLEKQNISDEEKSIVIELGMKALMGENLDI